MNYPSIKEYKEAILFAEDNFDQLKNLRPVLGEDGEPVMTSGNFAVVFKMKDEQTGKLYAVKCFLREQEGRAEAYRQIAEELENVNSTFLTHIKYLDKELFVDTNAGEDKEFPVLVMDWVEGDTLDKYIRKHLDDQYELSLLAYQFSRLAMWLMPQPFAHGDLKPDNILVKSDGTLVLVDYDGMYVPAMKGQRARELGSPDFRHPSRTEKDFDEHIDDFSLASILLSLKAITLQPSLLEEYGAQDRLLFSEKDYHNLSESKVMDALKSLMQDAELASLYSLFILALSQNNLSQVSFRLFKLNRPKEPELAEKDDACATAMDESIPHENERCWPLLIFAKEYGPNMQVGSFVNKNTGEKFKSCIFTKPDGTRTFVAFSSKLGELTPKEIAAIKEELVVVQLESGNYSLCKSNNRERVNLDNKVYKKYFETRLISKETIISRELQIKAPNSKFGIMDVVIEYLGDIWGSAKYNYRNIKLDNQYNISDIHSLEYNRESDLLKLSFNHVLSNGYDTILFTRRQEKVHMEFYHFHYFVKDFDSRYNKAFWSLEELFYAFCSLSQLECENAIVTLNNKAFQVDYVENYYDKKLMRMDLLNDIRYVFDEIEDEDLSTEVLDDDFAITWTDEFGVQYSADRKRLLKASPNIVDYSIKAGTKVICNNAFKKCKDLLSVSIPNGVLYIGESAFWHRNQLKSVVLPDSVFSLGRLAFFGCSGLTTLTFPEKLRIIGDRAFFACAALKSIIFTNCIEKIGEKAFFGCSKLNEIAIPVGTRYKFEALLPEYKDKLVEQEMGWTVKETRPFNNEEIAAVSRAEVVASQYGNSVCFFMNEGGQTYIPLSKQSELAVGDTLDLKTAKILTLSKKGKDDITRIIE